MLSKLFCHLTILRWLYSLNLTIDANFHLKNKAWTSGIEKNPPLGDRWGHWVLNKLYQKYISEYGGQVKVYIYISNSVL